MLRYCIAVLFSFCPLNVHAQYLYMKHFTAANGLPSNTVNDVLQDDDGFIWFATDNGVSKFDGHHFTNFTTKDGIADNEVIRLGKDHQSRMWFLGFNGKSSFYLKGKFYNENNSRVAAQTQLSSVFSKFLISKTKTIYLISNTDGFIQVNGDSVKKFSKELLRKQFGIGYINGYKTVKLDADNNLWIFSGDSALIFKNGNLTTQPPEHRQVSSKMVLSHFLSDGSYVEPSLGKLIRYTGNKKDSITNLPGNSMFDYVDLEEDGNNNLWLMTKSGAYIFRDKKFDEQHQKKILDGKYCGHVFTDNQFNTWLTPLRDGVYLIPSLDIQFISTQDGLSNNNVLVITDRPQGAIIGFANGSAQFIQVQNHSLLLQQPFAIGSYMLDILPAKNHQLLFLTNAEVITTDDHFNILKRKIVNWAKSYTQLQDGSLLIGGGFLLSSLKNEKITLLFKFNNENRIYCIAEDEQKIIWLGTEEGLYSFHDSIMQFQGEKFSLVKGRINDLKFDDRGRLWIASSQNGLLLKDKNDIRSMLDTGENISVRKIFLGHDKNIYAGSDKGIFILTENGNRNCKITHIKKSDGLASEKINTLLVKDSMIWVGTDEGLQIFQLNKKLQQLSSIPIRLTQFTVNGKTFSGDSTLNLSYRQNNIHVSFIGINFREPQSVTYRYRFESAHDSIWKYTNNSSLDLPELPAGNYQITIQAATSQSNWSAAPLQLSFFIHSSFWKTWWFYLIVAIAFATSAVFIFRYRLKLQVKEEARKRKSVEAELAALRSQMNPHFIFNSLNAIQDFIFQHKTEEANEYLSKFAKLIRAILNQSRKQFATIEEECELLKMYLELELLRFDNAFEWEIKIGNEIMASEMLIPSMLLQPVVENSIKHGFKNLKRKGWLKISFEKENDSIVCVVQDNGSGRTTEKNADGNSHSLSITLERLAILNQSLHQQCTMEVIDLFDDGVAAGLKTVFRFPVDIQG